MQLKYPSPQYSFIFDRHVVPSPEYVVTSLRNYLIPVFSAGTHAYWCPYVCLLSADSYTHADPRSSVSIYDEMTNGFFTTWTRWLIMTSLKEGFWILKFKMRHLMWICGSWVPPICKWFTLNITGAGLDFTEHYYPTIHARLHNQSKDDHDGSGCKFGTEGYNAWHVK